ncbi:MAG TPA: hypothetical protein PK585_09870, partial [Amphiplicatus sp.]|nr:hypothetical protein [Amphiplicatus sp.]
TRKLIDTRNWMIEEIESIEDYKVLRNHCLMMPFRSETLDMLRVLGGLVERGYFPWGTMEPLMVHPSAELVDESVNRKFIADLKEVTSGVKSGEITAEALATYI